MESNVRASEIHNLEPRVNGGRTLYRVTRPFLFGSVSYKPGVLVLLRNDYAMDQGCTHLLQRIRDFNADELREEFGRPSARATREVAVPSEGGPVGAPVAAGEDVVRPPLETPRGGDAAAQRTHAGVTKGPAAEIAALQAEAAELAEDFPGEDASDDVDESVDAASSSTARINPARRQKRGS